ncbi:MAG: bacteriophage Gp15 family protein [Clostridiales bacterium]|nr:bacteriophage Gp15 family protein [Clostridiales bacterium]
MIWELPDSLMINGTERAIRTDFRDILKILVAFEDPDLEPEEKEYICLYILYADYDDIPKEDYAAAYKAAISFIDNGAENDTPSPRTMDWEQDANILFPAVNRVAGFEVRSVEYLHWWTFTGYFLEIRDSVYANVLSIRQKKAKGKKLEKWEKEFWNTNKKICVLNAKLTEEEKAEKDQLKALLG